MDATLEGVYSDSLLTASLVEVEEGEGVVTATEGVELEAESLLVPGKITMS